MGEWNRALKWNMKLRAGVLICITVVFSSSVFATGKRPLRQSECVEAIVDAPSYWGEQDYGYDSALKEQHEGPSSQQVKVQPGLSDSERETVRKLIVKELVKHRNSVKNSSEKSGAPYFGMQVSPNGGSLHSSRIKDLDSAVYRSYEVFSGSVLKMKAVSVWGGWKPFAGGHVRSRLGFSGFLLNSRGEIPFNFLIKNTNIKRYSDLWVDDIYKKIESYAEGLAQSRNLSFWVPELVDDLKLARYGSLEGLDSNSPEAVKTLSKIKRGISKRFQQMRLFGFKVDIQLLNEILRTGEVRIRHRDQVGRPYRKTWITQFIRFPESDPASRFNPVAAMDELDLIRLGKVALASEVAGVTILSEYWAINITATGKEPGEVSFKPYILNLRKTGYAQYLGERDNSKKNTAKRIINVLGPVESDFFEGL